MPQASLAIPSLSHNRKARGDPIKPIARGGHTRTLPSGGKIAKVLRKYFRLQRQEIAAKIGHKLDRTIDLAHWNEPMAKTLTPLIADYWRDGAVDAAVRIQRQAGAKAFAGVRTKKPPQPGNLDIGFDVFNQQTLEAIKKHTFDFVRSTNGTSEERANEIIKKLRSELSQGLERGEALKTLGERMHGIFGSPARSLSIAATESSRALHAGEVATAKASGVVSGLQWLASSDACPEICAPLSGKIISLDGAFIEGAGYDNVPHPPAHPFCQCTAVPIISDDFAPALPEGTPTRPGTGTTQPAAAEASDYREMSWKEAEAMYLQIAPDLSNAERIAVGEYTSIRYKLINDALRKGKVPHSQKDKDTIRLVDATLDRARMPRNAIAYRGADLLDMLGVSKIRNTKGLVGTIIEEKAYLSTTIDRSVAKKWSNDTGMALFEVRVPKGTKAAYVSELSQHKKEAELLLARNQKLRIVKAKVNSDGEGTVVVEVVP